jgi:hypothetical protein
VYGLLGWSCVALRLLQFRYLKMKLLCVEFDGKRRDGLFSAVSRIDAYLSREIRPDHRDQAMRFSYVNRGTTFKLEDLVRLSGTSLARVHDMHEDGTGVWCWFPTVARRRPEASTDITS